VTIYSNTKKEIYPCLENQCTYHACCHNAENGYDESNILKQQKSNKVKSQVTNEIVFYVVYYNESTIVMISNKRLNYCRGTM